MNGKKQITISRIKAEQVTDKDEQLTSKVIFSAYGIKLITVQLSNGFKIYHADAINLLTPSLKKELDERMLCL